MIKLTLNFVTGCPTQSIRNGRFVSIENAYSKQKGNLRVDISGVISAGKQGFNFKHKIYFLTNKLQLSGDPLTKLNFGSEEFLRDDHNNS